MRARTADYGLPGFEFGAIYTHELHKVMEPYYSSEPQYILGGMDYGWSQTEAGGKTVCHFVTGNTTSGINVFGEFVWDNAVQPLTTNALVDRIVAFFVEQMEKMLNELRLYTPLNLVVRCDNSNIAIIQMLNNRAVAVGVHR